MTKQHNWDNINWEKVDREIYVDGLLRDKFNVARGALGYLWKITSDEYTLDRSELHHYLSRKIQEIENVTA